MSKTLAHDLVGVLACVCGLGWTQAGPVPAISAAAGQSPPAVAWGEAVDGAQMRIAVAPNAPPPLPGDLPVFEVQVRNHGSDVLTVEPEAMTFGDMEIDGVWYLQIHAGSCCARPERVTPGSVSAIHLLRADNPLFTTHTPAVAANIRPGRHTVRVRTFAGPRFSIRRDAAGRVSLISNAIVVDIRSASSAVERRALVERAAAGDAEGLRAARRLVAAFPDAAIPAFVHAIETTSDAGIRAAYVSLAGTIPGDLPIAFLTSQLAPNVNLLSQVTAADALLAHGRLDWVPPLIDVWHRVRRVEPQASSFHDLDATAQLIAVFVRSDDVAALDALADDADAPVDVRLAVVYTLLPPDTRSGVHGQANGASLALGARHVASLPTGETGRAIDRLLVRALDDTASRVGLSITYDGTSYADPRVCDMAALVMATRWPDRYHFTWPANVTERDAQIAAIRNAWHARPGS
ncbi:MAG TPA: hypothetical protein VG736_06620 [Vicinamibacterales bacterium]|nr:hypothetical protein [Vicinamibacterales bacterium]